MRFLLSVMSVGFASLAFGEYHSFNASKGIYDLSNPAAFNIDDPEAFTAAKTMKDSANQCGSLQQGTYTLSSDTYFNRFVFDVGNKNIMLNFAPYTFYSVGINSTAISGTQYASGTTVTLASGTICIPDTFKDVTYSGAAFQMANSPEPLSDFTFKVSGATSTLRTPIVNMIYGTNLCMSVENGGTLAVKSIGVGAAKNAAGQGVNMGAGNVIRIDGGTLLNYNTDSENVLALGGNAASSGNRIEILNGSTLSGWNYLKIDSGIGNILKFAGLEQESSLVSASTLSQLNGVGNRLEVSGGAKLTLNTPNGSLWVGTSNGSYSNVVRVSGTGSKLLMSSTYGTRIGTGGGWDNRVEVDDHAYFETSGILLGRFGEAAKPSKGNVIRVSNGACFCDKNSLQVGVDNAYGISNALEVVSGGIVSNVNCYISSGNGGNGNRITISDAQMYVSSQFFMTQAGGSGDELSIEGAGSKMTVCSYFNVGSKDAANPVSNLRVRFGDSSVTEIGAMLRVWGDNHQIVVSNGVVRTVESIQITGWSNDKITTANNTLLLAGDRPVIRSAKDIEIGATTKVRFEVDGDGYAEAPLHAPDGVVRFINAGETLEVDVSRLQNRSRDDGAKYYVLAEAKTLTIPDAEVEAAAATLPKGFRLRKDIPAEGPQRLLLRAPSTAGMVLIFR